MSGFDRYDFIEAMTGANADGTLWLARDTILDRPVSIRILDADDPRAIAVLGAARAAARVDDRRLLRVLDVLNLPADDAHPARIAIVSEWANGRSLAQIVEAEGPLDPDVALNIVAEVGAAVSAGLQRHVSHGRLRPSSVLITDAGEVRVRGLAVDAALMGGLPPDLSKELADVDGLGTLLAYLTTGQWSGDPSIDLPRAPEYNGAPLPPSSINANVPRRVDDVVARSIHRAERPRGVGNISDATAFTAIARAALVPESGGRQETGGGVVGKFVGVIVAIASVVILGILGYALLNSGTPVLTPGDEADSLDILTVTETPVAVPTDEPGEAVITIVKGRSFDPFGDDNDDGRPDRRKGRENNADRALAIDGDRTTVWSTARYTSADLDGKPGVGYLVDLGGKQTIRSVTVVLNRPGADLQIKVASEIFPDPDLWTPFADVRVASDEVTVRSPRPIDGQYVLVWFTRLPADPDARSSFQGGIADIVIRG